MLPVIEIPGIVSGPASFFSALFWKRQQKHFKEYVTGLIVSSKATISTMNRLFLDGNDQSSLNKFLTESDWDEKAVNDRRLEMLQRNGITRWKPWGIVAIDDTLCHKTGKDIEGVGEFYDHAEGKCVMAHNLVTSHYSDKEISYPLDYRLYHKDGSETAKAYGFRTKIELCIELIHDAMARHVPAIAFVFDSWFLCEDVAGAVESYGKAYVAPAKSNRIIRVGGAEMNITEYARTVPAEKFRDVKVGGRVYAAYSFACSMSKLGKVRACISREKGDVKDFTFFVTNMLDWEEGRMLNTYAKRWTIDAFYRDAKQELGFEDYQVRKLKGIMRHWYLVFVAYSVLKLGMAKGRLGRWLDAETIGKACRHVVIAGIRTFLKWTYAKFRENVSIDKLMEMLSIKIAKV
jgi:hypothetical protein